MCYVQKRFLVIEDQVLLFKGEYVHWNVKFYNLSHISPDFF